jgi:hypothetical protein
MSLAAEARAFLAWVDRHFFLCERSNYCPTVYLEGRKRKTRGFECAVREMCTLLDLSLFPQSGKMRVKSLFVMWNT